MPPITITTPAVGSPTRRDGFAQPVKDSIDYLNSQVTDQDTLLRMPNGSFESGSDPNTAPAGWDMSLSAGNSTYFETNASYVHHGKQSFKMTNPGGVSGGVTLATTEFIKCSEGNPITITWQILASVANITNAVKVRWYDANESLISTSTLWSDSATNPTQWQQMGAIATPPSNAKLCKVVLEGVNSTVAGDVYWDGLFISTGKRVIIYTASGTYVPSAGVALIKARMWAGGGGGGGGGNYAIGSVGPSGGAGGPGGDSYVGDSAKSARGGVGGGGGAGVNQSVEMVGAGGSAPAAVAPTFTTSLLRFGKLAGTAGGSGKTFNSATQGWGGTNSHLQNGIMTAGGAGGPGEDIAGQNGLANSGAAGGGGGPANWGPGGGGAGAHGEYAEAIISLTEFTAPINVVVGAGGTAGTGGTTGIGGGAGGSGLVILEEIG